MPDFSIEKVRIDQGYKNICGIDEAGRGPLCGPVVAAACILPIDVDIPRLNDSKKLPPKVRMALFDEIREKASSSSQSRSRVTLAIIEAAAIEDEIASPFMTDSPGMEKSLKIFPSTSR